LSGRGGDDNIFNMELPREKFEIPEIERFLEKYEFEYVRSDVLERIVTLVIAALGLIAALAWDEALRHVFEIMFGSTGTLSEELSYAVIITVIAALISVYVGRSFKKRKDK
jgi:ABC-type Mn2+/Zn2+ transport system permease subunit